MQRRSFLKVAGASAVAAPATAQAQKAVAAAEPSGQSAAMPRRALGRTGEQVSIVGYPGLGLVHYEQQECTESIHRAFDAGVNYFDVAPAYGQGDCEVKMGVGLEGIDRGQIFLACKTKARDAKTAREELERSLRRLKTDHFDLYQMHVLKTPEEVRQALGPGGAMETFLKAKEEGKVRYFGFSAHTTKGALEALNGYRFDTVMFPINFVEYFTLGFGKAVLELAKEQGAAVLAIKPLSRGLWPEGAERTRKWWYQPIDDDRELDLAMRFTLSLDGVAAGIPPGWLDVLAKAVAAAPAFKPITPEETEELRQLAARCQSVFRREEQQVACGGPRPACYPDSPHDGGGCEYA